MIRWRLIGLFVTSWWRKLSWWNRERVACLSSLHGIKLWMSQKCHVICKHRRNCTFFDGFNTIHPNRIIWWAEMVRTNELITSSIPHLAFFLQNSLPARPQSENFFNQQTIEPKSCLLTWKRWFQPWTSGFFLQFTTTQLFILPTWVVFVTVPLKQWVDLDAVCLDFLQNARLQVLHLLLDQNAGSGNYRYNIHLWVQCFINSLLSGFSSWGLTIGTSWDLASRTSS